MGCEVLAVSADGREKAEGFVSAAFLAFDHTPPRYDAMRLVLSAWDRLLAVRSAP